jgi:hypothetical protein
MPAGFLQKGGLKSRDIEIFASFLDRKNGATRGTHGESISSAAGSLARTSVTPESGKESAASGPGSGRSSLGSFAYFDPATSSWKTYLRSLFEGSIKSSVIWPNSGTMRNGTAFPQRPLVPHIVAGECLSWPTPTVNDSRGGRNETSNRKEGSKHHAGETLVDRITKMYPTPRADGRDNAGGSNSRATAKANGTYFGRTLNPQFVEWLMGFPLGWTDLDVSEMPYCRK